MDGVDTRKKSSCKGKVRIYQDGTCPQRIKIQSSGGEFSLSRLRERSACVYLSPCHLRVRTRNTW